MCISQFPNSSHPFLTLTTCPFSVSASLIPALEIGTFAPFFSKFHVYGLIYVICSSLSDLPHSVWQTLGPATPLQMTQFLSFLSLSSISLCICTIPFFHSSVCGNLGCHVLSIVNGAEWTLGCMCPFQLWFSQGICPVVGFLGHMVVLFLVFLGISILLSTVPISVYLPTSSARGFLLLHTLSSFYCSWIFWWWPFWLVSGDTILDESVMFLVMIYYNNGIQM